MAAILVTRRDRIATVKRENIAIIGVKLRVDNLKGPLASKP
jgi:hypothetical protein